MRQFFKTVAIVTVFGVSEKFLGFLYRIFLSRTIGAEGIGLYQVALSVFALCFTFCSSGIPITVSRLMTKYKAENKPEKVKRIISAGIFLSLSLALITCALFFIFKNYLGFLFADKRSYDIFYVILPGLIFTSVYAVLRGVFWGNKDFLPYSIIELLEEIAMICSGIILITYSTDVFSGAFSAGLAVFISYVFSFTLGIVVFFLRKGKLSNPFYELKPIVKSSFPVTAMRMANTVAVSIVSIVLPIQLVNAGIPENLAMSEFGAAVGQALPLLFIPSTLIGSFTLVLIPEISDNYYRKDYSSLNKNIVKAIKFTVFISSLFIPLYIVLGEEIGVVIFGNTDCGEYLTYSAVLMLFISLSSLTTSILNSIGYETKTLIYYIISGAFMLLSIWFLPFVVGIYALLIGFSFVYGLSTILNLRLIKKSTSLSSFYIVYILKSVAFYIPTVFLGILLEKMLLPVFGTVLTLFTVSVILVVFLSLLFVGFNMLEIELITKKLKFLEKFKKIKATKIVAKKLP